MQVHFFLNVFCSIVYNLSWSFFCVSGFFFVCFYSSINKLLNPAKMKYCGIGPCMCPEPATTLPDKIAEAAISGKHEEVMSYINHGGDINASCDKNGWTILGAACSMGRASLVEKLLGYPDLHLNTRSMNSTPLVWALEGEHSVCVALLLRSSLPCFLDLNCSWPKIHNFIIYNPKLWCDVVHRVALCHDIERLQALILMKNVNYKIDTNLLNFAMKPCIENVTQILNSTHDIRQFLDGTLIALSCFFTSEEVARALLLYPHEYCQECIELSLNLCSMSNCLGIMPVLLQKFYSSISYEALCNAHQTTFKAEHKNATRLLEKALVLKCQMYLPDAKDTPKERNINLPTPLPTRVASLIKETPGTPDNSSALATPSEAIELGTPALEDSNLQAVASQLPKLAKNPLREVEKLLEASSELESVSNKRVRLTEVGIVSPAYDSNELFKEAIDAQVKVAEALSLASKALAKVTMSLTCRSSRSSTKGSQIPECTDEQETDVPTEDPNVGTDESN